MSSKTLNIAAIGCGGRTRTYVELAAKQPERYRVVAAADPNTTRLQWTQKLSKNPDFKGFKDAHAILEEPPMADVMIIGTQDHDHREHAIAAMEKGYDLLLEKPIAVTHEDISQIHQVARNRNRKVLVCHVLRYTEIYRKIKSLIVSGALGNVVSLNATEGVGAWHNAHSYVRGHWACSEKSSPMILAKSCHDLDIIRWLIDAPCTHLSSYANRSHFNAEHQPTDAPQRCFDGCPQEDNCIYHAKRYFCDQSKWLNYICDIPEDQPEERKAWLHQSPWGRCVYACDNNVVDHQTVNMQFENKATATFTMTAFEGGRQLEIFGTKARLYAGTRINDAYDCDILIKSQNPQEPDTRLNIDIEEDDYDHHMGGDSGLMLALYNEMQKDSPEAMTSSLEQSVESHLMALAAEKSRLTLESISLASMR